MKPTLLYIAALVVMVCAVFASCERLLGEQEKKLNRNQEPMPVDFLKFEYSMKGSQEMMDYVDIEITYANGKGELVTDTITRDSIEGRYTSFQDFDGKWKIDSTHYYWQRFINIDTIPARLYLKSRYLMKANIDVDKDKIINLYNRLEFMDYPDSTASYLIGDVSQHIDVPLHSVRGSKLKAYLELVNENPPVLDYIVQPTASNPQIGEYVKNE